LLVLKEEEIILSL